MENEQIRKITRLKYYSMAVIFVIIVVSLSWNLIMIENSIIEAAAIDAKVNYNKDLLYRRWNSSHGGVYVPISDLAVPNPYLSHLPFRDLVINDTLTLTLINPALMTRKIYELAAGEGLVSSRIISDKPLNPLNQADSIELIALSQLGSGDSVFKTQYEVDNTDYMKFVFPFLTEEPCLKCHAHQGYKVGDIRGAISFTLPMTKYQDAHSPEKAGIIIAHTLFLLIGFAFIHYSYRRFSFSLLSKAKLTAELEEFNNILQQTQVLANLGHFKYWLNTKKWVSSEIFDTIFGISNENEKNLETWLKCIHPSDRDELMRTISSGIQQKIETLEIEYRILHYKTKQERWVRVFARYNYSDNPDSEFLLGTVQDITETKLAERRLIESETRWRFAIDGSDLGLWDWDIPTGKVFFSDRWKTMLGYSVGEIGDSVDEWSKRIHPDDMEVTMQRVKMHLAGETPSLNYEHRVLCKDGSFRWILDKGMVVERDSNGKAKRMIGTHTDIHELKMLEFKLSRNQDLFVQGPTVVWLINYSEGLPVLHTTPNVNEQLGYASEVLLNSNISYLSLIHWEDRAHYLEDVNRYCNSSSASFSHEYRLQHANGHYVWINDFTAIIRDEKGTVYQLRAYLNDISERKTTFATLSSALDGNTSFSAGEDGWEYWLTPEKTFRYISPSAGKILGVSLEKLKKNPELMMEKIHPQDRETMIEHHLGVIMSQSLDQHEIEFRILKQDGSIRWISHHCVPVYLEDGSYGGRRGINRDVTDRKVAELKVLAALKEKETLFKEVHHRVKNNFQLILSLLSLHKNNTDSDVEADVLQDVYSRIYAMALIHDLMHRPSQSGIKNYLNELISYLKRSYIQVPDQIKVETSFDDVEIGIDSMIAVGLIINELFSNSTKYAFKDGVSGSILTSFTVNNGHYSLTYQDTGRGFMFPVTDDLLTSSLGVKLINIFTAQLRGTIVNNPTSQGMSITIAFSGKL